ncbi:MAG: protein phosphatase 2C domain-containing protein [Bacteroidales bacterium]|nr:protein phosphatase 2C domain-containing protein [Bacteroidales bacterium]
MECMKFGGKTDVGKVRTNNEDAFIAQNIWDENHILAVAIDGVGGYEGGEVASGMAKKYIVEYLGNYSDGERLELLKQAVIYANNNIFSARRNLPQYSGMCCVLTAILVDLTGRCVHMAHVGDTRLYQYADGELVKLSHGHSLVGYREEIGELTEDEAMHHTHRNVIERSIGSSYLDWEHCDYVEIATFPLKPQSFLMLCSDGLSDMLKSCQIKSVLEQKCTVEETVERLIAAANDAGGKDNVTVVLVELSSAC